LQWSKLVSLTLSHFTVDMYGGMLAAILPVIRSRFGLSLTMAVGLITLLNIVCNLTQIFTGPLRAQKTTPVLVNIGLVLGSVICFLSMVPASDLSFMWLCLMVMVVGVGVAFVHPEGLRAVHELDKIPSAVSTAFFMNGGFLGFSGGALLSAILVQRFGLEGIYFLLILPAAAIVAIWILRVDLAVEDSVAGVDSKAVAMNVPFRFLFFMAVPVATSSTIIAALLPTCLNELGFELDFGALPMTLFGIGGCFGALFWASVASKKGELICCVFASFLCIPFLLVHFIFMRYSYSIWALLPAGFCAVAAFSLIVSMARRGGVKRLGNRMGVIIGGVWGVANIVLLAVGPIAEKFGVRTVINISWLGYLVAGILGLYALRKTNAVVCKPTVVLAEQV